jgi:hypothetical protein
MLISFNEIGDMIPFIYIIFLTQINYEKIFKKHSTNMDILEHSLSLIKCKNICFTHLA